MSTIGHLIQIYRVDADGVEVLKYILSLPKYQITQSVVAMCLRHEHTTKRYLSYEKRHSIKSEGNESTTLIQGCFVL